MPLPVEPTIAVATIPKKINKEPEEEDAAVARGSRPKHDTEGVKRTNMEEGDDIPAATSVANTRMTDECEIANPDDEVHDDLLRRILRTCGQEIDLKMLIRRNHRGIRVGLDAGAILEIVERKHHTRLQYAKLCTSETLEQIEHWKKNVGDKLLVVLRGHDTLFQRSRTSITADEAELNDIILSNMISALRNRQVSFLVAPYSSKAQLAYLAKRGIIDVVIAKDVDMIAFGCPSILYNVLGEQNGNSSRGLVIQKSWLGCDKQKHGDFSFPSFTDEMLAMFFAILKCKNLKVICGQSDMLEWIREKIQEELWQPLFQLLFDEGQQHEWADDERELCKTNFLETLLLYRHPIVFDPVRRECVYLNPLDQDKNLMKYSPYADLCRDKHQRRHLVLEHLNKRGLATSVAEGRTSPITLETFPGVDASFPAQTLVQQQNRLASGEQLGETGERKRGRPRKNESPPKRKRGRPRKYPLPPTFEPSDDDEPPPKRKRGRPRKHPLPTLDYSDGEHPPKRKRGRPRKNPPAPSTTSTEPAVTSFDQGGLDADTVQEANSSAADDGQDEPAAAGVSPDGNSASDKECREKTEDIEQCSHAKRKETSDQRIDSDDGDDVVTPAVDDYFGFAEAEAINAAETSPVMPTTADDNNDQFPRDDRDGLVRPTLPHDDVVLPPPPTDDVGQPPPPADDVVQPPPQVDDHEDGDEDEMSFSRSASTGGDMSETHEANMREAEVGSDDPINDDGNGQFDSQIYGKIEEEEMKRLKSQEFTLENRHGTRNVVIASPVQQDTETQEKKEPSKEVSSGPPDEPLEGDWPDGWTKRVLERQSGSTKGTKDRYWYSPANKKFRSMNEVKRFLAALKTCKGDEGKAWKVLKGTK